MKVVLECLKMNTDASMGDHAILICAKIIKKVIMFNLSIWILQSTLFKAEIFLRQILNIENSLENLQIPSV